MKSIIQERSYYCGICGFTKPLEEHHCFSGTANRKQSEKYGLKVYVCRDCHNKLHSNMKFYNQKKKEWQRFAMKYYQWSVDDFIKIFGKSYI